MPSHTTPGLHGALRTCIAFCFLAGAGCSDAPQDLVPLDASVAEDAPITDADARPGRDAIAPGIPDAARDAAPEPPRTGPCQPRRAPLACNPRRIVDACGAFGETCTRVSRACFARREAGALCRTDGECLDGLACTATIGYGLCAPTPDDGDPCTRLCADPGRSFCDLELSPPACAPKRPAGESCASDPNACELGLFCSPEGVCTAPRSAGGTCGWIGECATGLTCRDGVCSEAPGVGDPCSDVCASGAFCDISAGDPVCRTRIHEGEECPTFGIDLALGCVDGLRCVPGPDLRGACLAPVALGGACSSDQDACDAGLRCQDALCDVIPADPVPPLGAPCDGGCGAGAYCGQVPSEIGICWSTDCEDAS